MILFIYASALYLYSKLMKATPRILLSKFYDDNRLGADGGQSSPAVKIEIAKGFYFYFPNFDARRKAVYLHDIHHLVTGYETTLVGESEISAWEIASGCRNYPAAFLINTSGLMIGLPFHFWGVLKAFARGRRTRNLYNHIMSLEQAMDTPVEELKTMLHLDTIPRQLKPGFTDFLLFLLFIVYGAVYSFLSIILIPFILVYSLYARIKGY